MISVHFGPFHPELEQDFVDTLREIRKGSFSRIAVVAPSRWLVRHLKEVGLKGGANLFNVSFHMLHTLSFQVLKQKGISPRLSNSLVFEYLLGMILKQGEWTDHFRKGVNNAGFSSALFQALRDLNDAGADPDLVIEAVKDGFTSGGSIREELFRVYKEFLRGQEELEMYDYTSLYRRAGAELLSGDFSCKFEYLLVYGFYDLTGSQLELIESLGRVCRLTWFFPYDSKDSVFGYARPFFDSEVMRFSPEIRDLTDKFGEQGSDQACSEKTAGQGRPLPSSGQNFSLLKSQPQPENMRSRRRGKKPVLVSACGAKDEVWWAAKNILELTDRRGYAFEDIGVVARSLEPYRDPISTVFPENSIPFSTSLEEPIVSHPLVRAAMALITLDQEGFPRGQLMEVFRSPYLRVDKDNDEVVTRPDLWDFYSRHLGIIRGLEEWIRSFEKCKENGDIKVGERSIEVDLFQVKVLMGLLNSLQDDFGAFPEKASFSEWVRIYRTIFHRYLGVCFSDDSVPPRTLPFPEWAGNSGEKDILLQEKQEHVVQSLNSVFASLEGFDRIGPEVSRKEFIDLFRSFVERARVPLGIPGASGRGVRVLDAMSSRGIGFKVLFILGMNEKSFPRPIQEEPFIRDSVRRELFQETLGYRVSEKLKAFDEERLLFHLILRSASDRVFILYQRSDESGKALSSSLYLSEVYGGYSLPKPDLLVPRNRNEKLKMIIKKAGYNYLNNRENIVNILFSDGGIDPGWISGFGDQGGVPAVLGDLKRKRGPGKELTGFDGMIGEGKEWWEVIKGRGFSSHALELYVHCPFRFFAERVLGLEYLQEPEVLWDLAPDRRGYLYHNILQEIYKKIGESRGGTPPKEIINRVVEEQFELFPRENPTGLPLIWKLKKEEISDYIQRVVIWDLNKNIRSGQAPELLEGNLQTRMKMEPEPGGILFKGRVDRVDVRKEKERISLKIIDYKSRSSPPSLKIETRMKRGLALQPLIYMIMARDYFSRQFDPGIMEEEFAFWYLTGEGEDGGPVVEIIDHEKYLENRSVFLDSLKYILNCIRSGFFFVNPDVVYCGFCNFSPICRKNDPAVRQRVERDERAAKFRGLGR